MKQLLSGGKERALVLWILKVSNNGYPPHKAQVQEMAEQIHCKYVLKINDASITLVEYPVIGEEWVDHFLAQYPTLQTAYAR